MKKNWLFFVATDFTEFKIILFWNAEEKTFGHFKIIFELFTITSQKYVFGIPDQGPGVKKAPYPGARSETL